MLVEPVAHERPEGLPPQRISMVELRNSPAMLERIVIINDVATERGGAIALALLSISLLRGVGSPVTMMTGDNGANADLAALGVDAAAVGGEHMRALARA
jgi:hypothetical protein